METFLLHAYTNILGMYIFWGRGWMRKYETKFKNIWASAEFTGFI